MLAPHFTHYRHFIAWLHASLPGSREIRIFLLAAQSLLQEILRFLCQASEWFYQWMEAVVSVVLSRREAVHIIVKTDNHPKLQFTPDKGKNCIVFGNADHPQGNKKRKEYIHISDDELFQEHLVIGYDRFHGWQITKLEGEFGCGSQYTTESVNSSIPLKDCALMRIGHTSILINVAGKF